MHDGMEIVNKDQVFRDIKFRENILDIATSTINGVIHIVVTSGK